MLVNELSDGTIKKALETYCEYDGYWLKLYHLAGVNSDIFSIASMDQMLVNMNKDLD